MTPVSRFVTAVAMACLPLLARGEGKCDDDPVPFGPAGKLVVAWSIPYPKDALVRVCGEDVFNQVDRALELSPYPPGYPPRYQNPKLVELFNDTRVASDADLASWKALLRLPMPTEAEAAFRDHLRDHHIRGAMVEHPPVIPAGYSLCTCVLQRGVIVYYPGNQQEDLYVRSHFSSTNPAKSASEIFAPRGGYWFSFKRDKIWFPVRLNRLLKEKAWMVLDILTPKGKPLKAAAIPAPYTVAKQARVRVLNQDFEAIRLLATFDPATFDPARPLADLEIAPP